MRAGLDGLGLPAHSVRKGGTETSLDSLGGARLCTVVVYCDHGGDCTTAVVAADPTAAR